MVSCSNCGTASDGAKFCPECGSPLAITSVAERRERRVVTVLFADLAGFTSRSENLDVEDVDAFLEPYLAELRYEVASTGGIVSSVAGDGMMAVFGAPVAHEDDPERGVRAALGIRDTFSPGGRAANSGLHVRVGVTTGEVLVTLVGGGDVRATGDVVNTAARLQAAAPIDGVLVDEVTHRATARSIVLEPADAIDAKGKSAPVAVWRAIEPRSVVPEQRRVGGLVLVGRDSEADLLRRTLDRSRREPSTQLMSVIGEPGIGKSRLVEELGTYTERIPDLVTWRLGRSLSYGEGVGFWALGEMVKSQAGIFESDSVEEARQKLSASIDQVVLDEGERPWVARHVGPLVGLEAERVGSEQLRSEAFAAWRTYFEGIAETGPTVLVFEDVHWADDALLDFIDLLADRAGAIPLLIVCTARPELFERREHWGGGKTNATTLSLTPLSGDDTGRLVSELLAQTMLPATVQQALLDRAGGNPLYAQEYVRMLQDREILVKERSGWVLAGEISDLPESIHGIIAARLDTLTPDEKAVLQDAAVIGPTAWLGAVIALGGRPHHEVDDLLHGLERKQLIQRARRSSIHGETEFSFGHALTRDVAYSQIRRSDRAEKHEAAAAWIERLSGERDDKAELLADHYQLALALREGLGEPTTELAPKAAAAFAEAARLAAAAYAHAAAAKFFRAAQALTPAKDAAMHAQLLLGEALAMQGLDAQDEEQLTRTAAAQVAVKSWEAAGMAELMLARWIEDTAERGEDADAHLALAAAYMERVPPCNTTFWIAGTQAYRYAISGKRAEVIDLSTRMIELAQSSGVEIGRALMLLWLGDARVALGDISGVADVRQGAATLGDAAYPTTPVAYSNLADILRGIGDMPGADEAYAVARGWAERFASTAYTAFILTEQAAQAYQAGDIPETERLLVQVNQHDSISMVTQYLTCSGRLALSRGDLATAEAEGQQLVASGLDTGSDEYVYHGLGILARCHSAQGRHDKALELCDQFLTRWLETGGFYSRALELGEIVTVLADAGRTDDIVSAAMLMPDIVRWRAPMLLMAEGRYSEAAELYGELGSAPLAAAANDLALRRAEAS